MAKDNQALARRKARVRRSIRASRATPNARWSTPAKEITP